MNWQLFVLESLKNRTKMKVMTKCASFKLQKPHNDPMLDLPIVQFVVIFLLFGLCLNNSSSLLVGSHVVNFSPMPTGKTKVQTHT